MFRPSILAGLTAFCLALPAAAAPPVEVHIDNFTFSPETVTIPAGTTVTWVNRDDIPHRIGNNKKTILSKTMDTDESFAFTFTEPGDYAYFCTLHPHMTGRIIVTADRKDPPK